MNLTLHCASLHNKKEIDLQKFGSDVIASNVGEISNLFDME